MAKIIVSWSLRVKWLICCQNRRSYFINIAQAVDRFPSPPVHFTKACPKNRKYQLTGQLYGNSVRGLQEIISQCATLPIIVHCIWSLLQSTSIFKTELFKPSRTFIFLPVLEFDCNAVKSPNAFICILTPWRHFKQRYIWSSTIPASKQWQWTVGGQIFGQPITYKARTCQTTSNSRTQVEPRAAHVDLVGHLEIGNTWKVAQECDSLQ